MRKSPIKSALLTVALKFTMFSRHFGKLLGYPTLLTGNKVATSILLNADRF